MIRKFVSRAGDKLQFAIEKFGISIKGKTCADLGSSTGGFVDCLLQIGASKVYSIDTAYGELAWKLRKDPRVVVLERTNALHVELLEKVDIVTIDVSWTKQKLIVPHALTILKPKGLIISLLKPHYEAEKGWLEKGRLKDKYLEMTLEKVRLELRELGIEISAIIESPIVGEKRGNKEYFVLIMNYHV